MIHTAAGGVHIDVAHHEEGAVLDPVDGERSCHFGIGFGEEAGSVQLASPIADQRLQVDKRRIRGHVRSPGPAVVSSFLIWCIVAPECVGWAGSGRQVRR